MDEECQLLLYWVFRWVFWKFLAIFVLMAVDRKKILTFSDAERLAGPPVFSAMAKPVGSACNLDCDYCYYLGKSASTASGPMSDEVLEEYIKQYIGSNAAHVVSFCWHGGEPLLAGKGFFRRALELQKRYGEGRTIENTVQTNGTLLDGEWCALFRDNGFLVGISIDGPRDIHDAHRRRSDGRGSWNEAVRGVEMLCGEGVEFNTLTTVNRAGEGRGAEVYAFLKSIGSRYMQFLPVVENCVYRPGEARAYVAAPGDPDAVRAPWAVSPEGFGRFMADIFDVWVRDDVSRYFVPFFDAVLGRYVGLEPALCTMGETCGGALAVECRGDVYSCDHFVFPEHRLGNIMGGDLAAMLASPEQVAFGLNKRNTLPVECVECKWFFACRGECPKHRLDRTEAGERINSLCEGYKAFLRHADPYMEYMAQRLAMRQAPAMVMDWARSRDIKI